LRSRLPTRIDLVTEETKGFYEQQGQGDAQSLETRSARVCELYDVIVLR